MWVVVVFVFVLWDVRVLLLFIFGVCVCVLLLFFFFGECVLVVLLLWGNDFTIFKKKKKTQR